MPLAFEDEPVLLEATLIVVDSSSAPTMNVIRFLALGLHSSLCQGREWGDQPFRDSIATITLAKAAGGGDLHLAI